MRHLLDFALLAYLAGGWLLTLVGTHEYVRWKRYEVLSALTWPVLVPVNVVLRRLDRARDK